MPRQPGFLSSLLACAVLFPLMHSAQAQTPTMREICDDCVVEKFASCGGFLEGASIDSRGVLWVVDLVSGNILTVSEAGQCTVESNTGGQPNGAKFHPDGRLFIADKAKGILAFNPADKALSTIASSYRSETLRGVNDLIFDNTGGLYFTEPYGSNTLNPNGRLFYLPAQGSLQVVADNIAFPNGVALSVDGSRVYVGEYANKRLLSLPSVTSQDIFDVPFVFANVVGGIGPDGFALDTNGTIYSAVFQSGQVQIISATGFPVGALQIPEGTFVTNLAFRDNYLYITESSLGVIWRVKVNTRGLPYYHQQ